MSVNVVDNNITVTASQEVEVANELVTTTTTITNEYPNTITVKSNEFAIVGDGLFATTKEEVPGWMRELVGDLARSATADVYNAMTGFNYNLYNAMIALQVAENKYQQVINTRVTDQEAFVQAVETLNSTAQNAQAEIVSIKQTYATKDFAVATAATTLEASINGGAIKSSLGQLASSMSNQYGTMAQRMDVLESTFEDLESGVEGYANATETLETYVGIVEGAPSGTGLLAKVEILQSQVDSKIEYHYQTTDPSTGWVVPDTRSKHLGDVWYKTDTKESVYYAYEGGAYLWKVILDKDALQAIKDAAVAQSTANSKTTVYFAFESTAAPTAPGTAAGNGMTVPNYWYNTSNSKLHHYTTSWVEVPTAQLKARDEVKTFKLTGSAVDYNFYEYTGSQWLLRTNGGLVARSKWAVELDGYIRDGSGTVGGASSTLISTVDSKVANGVTTSQAKFAYNSNITINGMPYSSGFGLATNAIDGAIPAGSSEFWINADKFKLTTTGYNGTKYSPFTVDGTNGSITFNGKVSFSSITGVPDYVKPAEVAAAINNNTTMINGSKIITGSITADKLSANAINAESLQLQSSIGAIPTTAIAVSNASNVIGYRVVTATPVYRSAGSDIWGTISTNNGCLSCSSSAVINSKVKLGTNRQINVRGLITWTFVATEWTNIYRFFNPYMDVIKVSYGVENVVYSSIINTEISRSDIGNGYMSVAFDYKCTITQNIAIGDSFYFRPRLHYDSAGTISYAVAWFPNMELICNNF